MNVNVCRQVDSADGCRAILEVVTIRLATHLVAIEEYIQRTLLYHTIHHGQLNDMVNSALQELLESELLVVDRFGGYEATLLSQATVASYLTPEDGIFLRGEFQKALKAFVMDGEMHIFYMFTPVTISGCADIDWVVFRREIENLDDSGLRVLNFVGINPAFVNRMLGLRPNVQRLSTNTRQGQQRQATAGRHCRGDTIRAYLSPLLHCPSAS